MNFEPDILASTLASKKTFRFVVLFPRVTPESTFWKSPLIGVEKALDEIGHYGVTIERFLFDPFSHKSFAKEAARLIEYAPDAFLLSPVYHEEAMQLLNEAEVKNIPYAFVNSNMEDTESLSYIGQDSFQSGKVAAKIMGLAVKPEAQLLVINISKNLNNHKHILKRKNGFISYFDKQKKISIQSLDIENTDQPTVNKTLESWFNKHGTPDGIFVTNSRIYKIAGFLKDKGHSNLFLIGYDLLDENVKLLNDGVIDFLISQKPIEQGYRGIMSLYNHVILHKVVPAEQHLPIDIIAKENLQYYLNN